MNLSRNCAVFDFATSSPSELCYCSEGLDVKTLKEKGQSDALHSLVAASELVGGETRHSFRIEEAPPVRSGYAARMAARYGVTLPAMLDTLRRSGVTLADTEGREFHE